MSLGGHGFPRKKTHECQTEKVRDWNRKPNKHKSAVAFGLMLDVFFREEKKKKQKQDGCNAEEKTESSSGVSAGEKGPKSGGGPSQQPLKRGQKVRPNAALL